MPRMLSVVVALLVMAITIPAAAQSDAEPARKGISGFFGQAADRLKEEALKRLDTNGDGIIDEAERGEAVEAIKKKGLEFGDQFSQYIVKKYDANGNGTLDKAERKTAIDETMKLLKGKAPIAKNTVLGLVQRRFDTNGDGTLDTRELAKAREELTKLIAEGVESAVSTPADPVARRKKADDAEKKDLLDRFDANGDGVLDKKEREAAKADRKTREPEPDDEPVAADRAVR
jgi:hypothetical protein